jgi:arylsulfatase A-like enzyme
VLFLGDNGTDAPLGKEHEVACAAPLRGKKGTHYEGGMRVPFIAAWARPDSENAIQKRLPIPAHTLNRQVGMITDVFPTVLKLVGVPFAGPVDGEDLSPLLKGGSSATKRAFLMHFPHDHRSSYFTVFREGDWKLVYHYREPAGQRCELFDLANDRAESTNLAAQEPGQRDRMISAMAEALKAANAQYARADEKGNAVLLPEAP